MPTTENGRTDVSLKIYMMLVLTYHAVCDALSVLLLETPRHHAPRRENTNDDAHRKCEIPTGH